MLSTLQEVANKIGTTILKGMADLKTQIATSTAAIRSDIEATRQDLRQAIGAVGQQLQTSIEQSTDLLYNQVGQQAASIRRDIFDSSQRLEQRLDDTGRAILGSIEQSKQELKYQIGAEAEATRAHITAKSDELKDHMTKETQGLREFIDVKTNQVIGVVREEGASTRGEVNKATNQIIREVRSEGAITRAFVDTKTNEIKEVVRSESAVTRELVDVSTKKVIGVVQEEGRTTRSFVDEKGNQVIGVVKDEGDKTRKEVRAEGDRIRTHIDEKTTEIVGVVRDEGSKTRADVNARAAELKQHVTDQSTLVTDQVKKTQSTLQSKMDKQYTDLSSGIEQVGDLVESSTATIVDGQKITVDSMLGLLGCPELWASNSKTTQKLLEWQKAQKALDAWYNDIAERHQALKVSVAQNPSGANAIVMSLLYWKYAFARAITHYFRYELDLATSSALNYEVPDQDNAQIRQGLAAIAAASSAQANKFSLAADDWSQYQRILLGEKIEFVAADFEIFQQSVSPSVIGEEYVTVKDTRLHPVRQSELKPQTDTMRAQSAKYKEGVDILYQVQGASNQLRATYAEAVSPASQCASAKKARDWTKTMSSRRLLRRSLEEEATPRSANEPFYAMTFSALTKILLDYRLQEAAVQFCTFYEFRNGGEAPPMCVSSQSTVRPYYTMSKIQEMRSWQPPVYPRIVSRIMLPTQPAYQEATGRTYPFVDLDALARGEAVNFDVPLWDFDWLKRYLWVLSNAKEDSLPTYYVESMRVYLPIEATNNASFTGSATSFAVTVYADSSMHQFTNWATRSSGRAYQLPSQSFQFDVVYNQPVCPAVNKATNPYHESAECISTTDRSSQVCLVQEVTENTPRLLPNLFSSWRFRANFDAGNTRWRLVRPLQGSSNDSNAVPLEMNLFADVILVRVASSTKSTMNILESGASTTAATTAGSCCAQNEHRDLVSGACIKCPLGSVSALNGYTCISV